MADELPLDTEPTVLSPEELADPGPEQTLAEPEPLPEAAPAPRGPQPAFPEGTSPLRVFRADGRVFEDHSRVRILAYDFRNPVFLSDNELARLRAVHEDLVRYVAARLSLFLRMEFSLRLTSIDTQSYFSFTEALPHPSHLSLFKSEPLFGVGIFQIPPPFALTLIDRMLGGKGYAVSLDRALTEIETALLEDLLRIFLEEWCGLWRHEHPELTPQIIGHETSARFLQTSPRDAMILTLNLAANFGDTAANLQFALPYATIEPLMKGRLARRARQSLPAKASSSPAWHAVYEHIHLPVRAEWDAFALSLREIASLKVGDVLRLPVEIVDQTRVILSGLPKFKGTVGLADDRVVVKITQQITSTAIPLPPTQSHGRS